MSLQTTSFMKGISAGLVIGAAVTMLCDPVSDRQRNRVVKRTEGAFKTMGAMVDSVVGMFH